MRPPVLAAILLAALALAGCLSAVPAGRTEPIDSAPAPREEAPAARPPRPDGIAPGLAFGVGVRDASEWRTAADAGFVPDAVKSHHWVVGSQDKAEVERVVAAAGRLAAETNSDVVLHYYYWGDLDHKRACFEAGGACEWGGRALSVEEWHARAGLVAEGLARSVPAPHRAIVVVETEFNNGDVAANRAWWGGRFNDLMIETLRIVDEKGGDRVETAVSLGAWRIDEYALWKKLLSSPHLDWTGTQLSGNHVAEGERCGRDEYDGLVERKIAPALRRLHDLSGGKKAAVWDVFVSSFGAGGEAAQADVFRQLEGERDALAASGLRLVVQRSLADNPAQVGCLGEDEKHFGLRTADGRWKPAFYAWRDAYADEKATPGKVEGEGAAFATAGSLRETRGGWAWALAPGEHARQTFRVEAPGSYRVVACLDGAEAARVEVLLNGREVWAGAAEAREAVVQVGGVRDQTLVVKALSGGETRVDDVRLVPAAESVKCSAA